MLTSIEYLVPILHVRDLDAVSQFFVKLGFEEQWRMGEPAHRAGLYFGPRGSEYVIHLMKREDASDAGARVYIQVPNVDEVYAGCVASGLSPRDLAERPYGMRDFDVVGPEEILVGIGTEIEH